MALLEDVGGFLVARGLVTDTVAWTAALAPGTDRLAAMAAYGGPPFLFRYALPPASNGIFPVVALEDYPGLPATRTFDGPDVAYPRVAITARGLKDDAATPRAVAQSLWDALNATQNVLLNGTLYESLWPLQSGVVPLGQDGAGLYRFRVNIEAIHNL
jgi:hypothetical protein